MDSNSCQPNVLQHFVNIYVEMQTEYKVLTKLNPPTVCVCAECGLCTSVNVPASRTEDELKMLLLTCDNETDHA